MKPMKWELNPLIPFYELTQEHKIGSERRSVYLQSIQKFKNLGKNKTRTKNLMKTLFVGSGVKNYQKF